MSISSSDKNTINDEEENEHVKDEINKQIKFNLLKKIYHKKIYNKVFIF